MTNFSANPKFMHVLADLHKRERHAVAEKIGDNAWELLRVLEAIHHQLTVGEASKGDMDDIRWCAEIAGETLDLVRKECGTLESLRLSRDEWLRLLEQEQAKGGVS